MNYPVESAPRRPAEHLRRGPLTVLTDAWDVYRQNALFLLAISLVMLPFTAATAIAQGDYPIRILEWFVDRPFGPVPLIPAASMETFGNLAYAGGGVAWLVSLMLLAALTELVVGRPITYGKALHGAIRRFPAYLGASLVAGYAVILPVALIGAAVLSGISGQSLLPGVLVILGVVVVVWVSIGLAVWPAAVVAEGAGPLGAIRRSWRLTSRHRLLVLATLIPTAILSLPIGALIGYALAAVTGPSPEASVLASLWGVVGAAYAVLVLPWTHAVSIVLMRELRQREREEQLG